jgi:transcriptional regulator
LRTLTGHVARANPVGRSADGREALVIFQGANACISPSWYPTKATAGMAVPTFDDVVVHARGIVRAGVVTGLRGLKASLMADLVERGTR